MNFQNIDLNWTGHAGFIIKAEGKIIYIDPYQINSQAIIPADIILITHSHYDHCSLEDISKIAKDNTTIIGPADIQSKISRIQKKINLKVIEPGNSINIDGINIGAIPSYNINKQFHPKNEYWNGYAIKINNLVIYHAGDTDLIPEMSKLTGKVTIALLPIGGNYTMNSQEAAKAASIIKPQIAIPMHYGNIIGSSADAQNFSSLCEQQGINSQILDKE